MSKILFIPFNLLSHIGRCITLAQSIKEDFQIYFLISKEYIDLVSSHSFKFELNPSEELFILNKAKSIGFFWMRKKDIIKNFQYLVSKIQEIKPDIVISDSNMFASLSCEYLKIPHISLMNTYMTRFFKDRNTELSYLKMPIRIFLNLVLRLVSSEKGIEILRKGEDIFLRKFHSKFREVRAKYQLKMKQHLFEEFEGNTTFLLDPIDIFPVEISPEIKVVGPAYYNSKESNNKNIKFPKDKPNILITSGSSGDIKKFLFIEKLNLSKFYNVILLGEPCFALKIEGAQRIKFANIKQIAEFIDVVICHGGNGTVYSFLSKGIPSIMIPSHIEQYWFSYQIHKHKLGILCTQKNEKIIIESIQELIEERKRGFLNKKSELFNIERSIENFRKYFYDFILSYKG